MARRLELFIGIDKTSRGRPLIVELPTVFDQAGAFAKSIRAAQQDHDDSSRIYGGAILAVLNHFRLFGGRKNQAIAGTRCSPGLDAIDATGPEKLVRIFHDVIQCAPAALK